MIGIKLEGGICIPGFCGIVGDQLELVIPQEKAVERLGDLMDPEKTRVIEYYVDKLIASYEGYTRFLYMQPDSARGKMDVWLAKPKG